MIYAAHAALGPKMSPSCRNRYTEEMAMMFIDQSEEYVLQIEAEI